MKREKSAARQQFDQQTLELMAPLYRGALHLTRDPDQARDLVQETYLRVYRSFAQFTPGTNLRAWAFTIMHSVFNSAYRRTQRAQEGLSMFAQEIQTTAVLEDDAEAQSGPVALASAAERMEWAESEIDHALQALPEEFRLAILLVDVGELSYDEAAALLACPVGTVRSRLFRARRLLFTALHEYAQQHGWVTAQATP